MLIWIIVILILVVVLFVYKPIEHFTDKNLKVCILIISLPTKLLNKSSEIYYIQREFWKKYYNQQENIDCYFIECDEKYEIQNNCIKCECQESYTPGIYQKTILSLKYLQDRDYDFYIRTNLNSFFIFPYLLDLLEKIKLDIPIYTGDYSDRSDWICGNSIIWNKKGVSHLLHYGLNKKYFNNKSIPDDVLIGKVMVENGIKPYPIEDIVYWITKETSKNKQNQDIEIVKQKKYPIIRTRPEYHNIIYYKQLMNKLLKTFYYYNN